MNLAQLMPLLDGLDALDIDYTASVGKGQRVSSIWISALRSTDPHYHEAISLATKTFDRLNKTFSGGSQSWEATKDGTRMTMYRIASCKVVGYRTVERKKMVEVETEEIETEEEPIYDCSEAE